jgi:mRNA interferase MazF
MPSDEASLKFGDVVLVPLPFTDQSTVKRRPAVVISRPDYHSAYPDTILMPVTSQMRGSERIGDVIVTQWQAAGLLKPSAIKPVIATIGTASVIRRLGGLASEDRRALQSALADMLGE